MKNVVFSHKATLISGLIVFIFGLYLLSMANDLFTNHQPIIDNLVTLLIQIPGSIIFYFWNSSLNPKLVMDPNLEMEGLIGSLLSFFGIILMVYGFSGWLSSKKNSSV